MAAGRIRTEAAFDVLAKAKTWEKRGKRILHFEIGEPDFETPQPVCDRACEAIREGHTHYVPSAGLAELREAVTEYIGGSRGFTPRTDQVLVTPGAKPVIFYAMTSLVDPGDEVIYPDPGFPAYGSITAYLGAKEVPVPLREENEFRLSPDELAENVTPKTKLIILNSPHNPTGSVLTKKDVEAIEEIAAENDCWVLSDEIYSEMIYGGKHYSVSEMDECRERTIILDGFSKNYAMAGWRLGYAVAPSKLIEKMTLMLINSVSCTNSFIQWAGIEALRGPRMTGMMESFRERRDHIVEGLNTLPGFKCLKPRGSFFVYPNISGTGMRSPDLADFLMSEAGVAALPGTAFSSSGLDYLRFAYAHPKEVISEAIECIREVL